MLFVVGVCCQEMSCRVSLLWSSSRPQSNLAVSSCLLNKQFLDNSRFLCNFPMNTYVRLLLACQFSKRARSNSSLLLLEHLLFILILIKSYRNNFLGIIWRNEICFFLGKNFNQCSAPSSSVKSAICKPDPIYAAKNMTIFHCNSFHLVHPVKTKCNFEVWNEGRAKVWQICLWRQQRRRRKEGRKEEYDERYLTLPGL